MATASKRTDPRGARTSLTVSPCPTLSPPVVMRTSARTSWSSMVSARARSSSGTAATRKAWPPASVTAQARAWPLASKTSPASRDWPGSTSSSPMETTTTRGAGRTRTRCIPRPARRATWRALMREPRVRTVVPDFTSSARRRTLSPAATAWWMVTRDSPRSVSAQGMTASAPSGMGAPESMRTAAPETRWQGRMSPARTASTTSSTSGLLRSASATSLAMTA